MIWVYDNAIVEDLRKSFNPNNVPNPAVSVIDPEQAVDLAAQIQQDKIKFPIVALTRVSPIGIDSDLKNFTKLKKGVPTTFDNIENLVYHERSIPINLSYELSVFTTTVADMDEIIRELLFKYASMYFLTVTIPYESKRQIRFGISIEDDENIDIKSTASNYISEGKLHTCSIRLNCEGCVLIHYTPRKLQRTTLGQRITLLSSRDALTHNSNLSK